MSGKSTYREIISKSAKETQKIAKILAEELLDPRVSNQNGAEVIALEGNLGSGKTTFIQGFARALGIKEKVLSPTFVLIKIYKIRKSKKFRHLIHIDCYRLEKLKDLLHLGLKNFLKDRDAVILIEWADRVKKLLPKETFWIKFKHGKKFRERILYRA